MCLAIPGQVVSVEPDDLGMPMAQVSFGGIEREVCLAFTPDAVAGDYVLVHIGFALHQIDEEEAKRTLEALEELLDPQELADEINPPAQSNSQAQPNPKVQDPEHEIPG
jgi:hydrogenase expression/formation protein HypC